MRESDSAPDNQETHRPIAIIGGGPAGMALALALNRHGVQAQVFDAQPRGAVRNDKRILALSHGSRQILECLGVWPSIAKTSIDCIQVSQRGGFGRTRLLAREEGVPALGYVASAASVGVALDQALHDAQIPFRGDTAVIAADATDDQISLTTSTNVTQASLAIYAEGRIEDDANVVIRDYAQSAVICTVKAEGFGMGPGNVAYERFTPLGPLALLPFGDELAVVYTCPTPDAEALANLSDSDFLSNLQAHFGHRLRFATTSARNIYPLTLRYRKTPVGKRCVWLGNAAQTLHPVAGQGFNLALRDAWDLSRALAATDDPGSVSVLAAYAARRRLDRRTVIGFTDSLVRLFSNDDPLLRLLRGAGLFTLDQFRPLRGFVARRMMYGARAWP